jgi:periplasmic protein TonB
MRTCTITISIVVHVIAVCAAVIAPLFATDELPAPRTATEFIQVVPLPEPPAPPPRAVARARVDIQRPDVPPLDVPDGIAPESVVEPLNDGFASDSGVVAFDDVNSAIVMDAPPPPPAPPSQRAISHVGGNIRPPQKIVDVAPVYPLIARAAHVGGVVILEAVIAEDGSVRDVNVLRSIPLLDAAAVEAVRQWRFSPTLLNGEPVPIVMTVTVAFRLH